MADHIQILIGQDLFKNKISFNCLFKRLLKMMIVNFQFLKWW